MEPFGYAQDLVYLGKLLISRLERLSADSVWAHRATGLRGALIRTLEQVEASSSIDYTPEVLVRLQSQIDLGFEMLNQAAIELI